jgi:hypothetical protein
MVDLCFTAFIPPAKRNLRNSYPRLSQGRSWIGERLERLSAAIKSYAVFVRNGNSSSHLHNGRILIPDFSDAGEEKLRTGDCAAFRSGDSDGHHLVNKSDSPARVLEIGTSDPRDRCTYPDIDMIADDRGYTHRDGTPYPLKK